MDRCSKTAALYIASLKAMALIHQHSHWTTKGDTFYGDHLLFERLYNSALKDLDLAAEKFIGLFGPDCLDYQLQAALLNQVLLKYKVVEGKPLVMSLAIEKDFIKLSQDAYNCFEDEDTLTLGLDDMVMSIASQREESVYLLQQVLDKKEAASSKLEARLQPKLTKRAQQKHMEVMQYLMRAVPLAAANVGINQVIVTQVDLPKQNGMMDTYATNIPSEKMTVVKASLDKLLVVQRPELAGKVNLLASQ